MQVSAFVPASIYLRKGLEALAQIETPWKDYYDMTLRLFRASADVELCLGNFDVGTTYCCVIIDNALRLAGVPDGPSDFHRLDRQMCHTVASHKQQEPAQCQGIRHV